MGQEASDGKKRYLQIAAGPSSSAIRDRGYSPLRYSGAVPSVMMGYGAEGPEKSELFWLALSGGGLENDFGARVHTTAVRFLNYTLYHREGDPASGLHLGWSNDNALHIRDFTAASNFSPRFDYHTSFGPAARYRYVFEGALAGLSLDAVAHFQAIGFTLQSGYVSDAPAGTEGQDDPGILDVLKSARLFYPVKAWDWGAAATLRYPLGPGNSLGFSYRYDRTSIDNAHRSIRSSGRYWFTIMIKL